MRAFLGTRSSDYASTPESPKPFHTHFFCQRRLFLPFSSILMRSVVCGSQPEAEPSILSEDIVSQLETAAGDSAAAAGSGGGDGSEVWMGTSLQCGGAVHVVVAAASILLLIFFSVLAFLYAATVVDRSPSSRSLSAKVHGRGDVALLLMKLVLSGLFNIGSGPFIGSAALAVMLLASGIFWTWLSFSYNLYVHPMMNSLEVSAACVYTWCCVALLMARADSTQDYAAFVYLGGPVAALCGFLLSKLYQESVADSALRDLTSLTSIEMWARSRLSKFAKAVIDLSIDGGGDEDETRRAYQAVLRSAEEIREEQQARRQLATRQKIEALTQYQALAAAQGSAAAAKEARHLRAAAAFSGASGGTPPLGGGRGGGDGAMQHAARRGSNHHGNPLGGDAAIGFAQPMPPRQRRASDAAGGAPRSPSAHSSANQSRQRRFSVGSAFESSQNPGVVLPSPSARDSPEPTRRLSKEKLVGLLGSWRSSAKRSSMQRLQAESEAGSGDDAAGMTVHDQEAALNETVALLTAGSDGVGQPGSATYAGGLLGTASNQFAAVNVSGLLTNDGEAQLDERSKAILAAVEHAKEAEKAYRYLLNKFPRSALAGVLAAAFWRQFGPMQLQEAQIVAQVLRVQPAFDLKFYCMQRAKQLSDGESSRPLEDLGDAGAAGGFGRKGGSGSQLSVVDSILQQQNMAQVQSLQTDALRGLSALWDGLAQRTPDLAQVLHVGEQLMHILTKIDGLYKQMLKMQPDAIQLLRSYGSFLINLNGQRTRAVEYLNRAERLESARTTQHMDESSLPFMMGRLRDTEEGEGDERAATITISASRRNTGEVVNVSSAATRLLGMSSERFKGMNIGAIVPQPLRAALPKMMDAFVTSGIGGQQRQVIGPSRMWLISRAGKALLSPVWMRIREAPVAPDSGEPRLFVHLHEILTSD